MKVRSGDVVQVIAGKDKGKKGKVLAANPSENRVLIEGVNIATQHMKKQGATPGQIIKIEKPIHVSNVKLVCPETGKPTRIGFRIEGDKKVRFSKKSGKTL